jgi:hypothetical protein
MMLAPNACRWEPIPEPLVLHKWRNHSVVAVNALGNATSDLVPLKPERLGILHPLVSVFDASFIPRLLVFLLLQFGFISLLPLCFALIYMHGV